MATPIPRISREGIRHQSLRNITDMVLNLREGKVDMNRAFQAVVKTCKNLQVEMDGLEEGIKILRDEGHELRMDLKRVKAAAIKPKGGSKKK